MGSDSSYSRCHDIIAMIDCGLKLWFKLWTSFFKFFLSHIWSQQWEKWLINIYQINKFWGPNKQANWRYGTWSSRLQTSVKQMHCSLLSTKTMLEISMLGKGTLYFLDNMVKLLYPPNSCVEILNSTIFDSQYLERKPLQWQWRWNEAINVDSNQPI